MAAVGLETSETGRIDILKGGLALLSRHRTSLLALALSGLFHAVLFWGLRTEVLSGSALFGLRSSSTVVRFASMPPDGASMKVGERRSELSVPDTSKPGPEVTPRASEGSNLSDRGTAQRLSSDAMPLLGGPLPELHYFSPDELSVKPQLMSDAEVSGPTFIPDILPLPVLVQLLINEQGGVDRVILGENFLSDVARKYIVESFSGMKFSPGMLGARPVKSQLQIVVNLDPAIPVN
ncbi:hypothetical protein [Curvibacter sp. PAE-UM]|uniref:hypothetical protein n=1 Tax=Curvibacter sp. PAE-UM TaxID=1714344 RepID=UPI00070D8473|nr:hypothetical protein [Curvibacter sp. PAE-UM]KRI01167.1 hypothetical protein AO057_09860 [Curvibacter sp. PAE-UM]